MPEFQDSEATSEFIRRIDLAFDLMNSCNPLAKGSKQPVTLEYFPKWARECDKLSKYIFNLRTIDGDVLWKSKRKTVILGFAASIQSVKAVVEELLHRNLFPYKFEMTYKFSQDNTEMLFSKIRQCSCWNNNPNVLQFKNALWSIIIQNGIEPSKTGNCTNFDDALCESEGLVDFCWKRPEKTHSLAAQVDDSEHLVNAEKMLIQNDIDNPNMLLDNILYFMAGFIVRSLLGRLSCTSCMSELLLDPNDCYRLSLSSYPFYTQFTVLKQNCGLLLHSLAELK